MCELEQHYNGYRYHVKAKNSLYNPFVIQNYFESNGELRNYFAESGGTKILLRSLNEQDIPDLRNYLDLFSSQASKIQILSKEITTPKDWEKLQKDFKQNAFDAGYLTIAGSAGDEVDLKMPNLEVFKNMQQLLKDFLGKKDQFGEVLSCFTQERFQDFFEALEVLAFKDKAFLNLAEKNPRIKRDVNYEPLLHTVILMAMRFTLEEGQKNKVISNFVIKNRQKPAIGRKRNFIKIEFKLLLLIVVDLYIEIKEVLEVLFEFKLVEKESTEEAIKQVFKKKYDSEFKMDKGKQEKYIIGVAMDARKSNIIQEFKVLKYSKEKQSWDDYHEETKI